MFGKRRNKQGKLEKEFEREILVHLDPLYATALRLTGRPSDAEDLVQDACLKAFRFFHQYERGTNARAWAFRILVNTFINRYRRKRSERQVISGLDLAGHQERLLAPHEMEVWSDPEVAFFRRSIGDEVLAALDSLSDDFRTVVLLAGFQDFTYREIADLMGIPIGTVMSRLYRARRALQARLYDYAVEQGYLPEHQDERGETVSLEEFRRRQAERKEKR